MPPVEQEREDGHKADRMIARGLRCPMVNGAYKSKKS